MWPPLFHQHHLYLQRLSDQQDPQHLVARGHHPALPTKPHLCFISHQQLSDPQHLPDDTVQPYPNYLCLITLSHQHLQRLSDQQHQDNIQQTTFVWSLFSTNITLTYKALWPTVSIPSSHSYLQPHQITLTRRECIAILTLKIQWPPLPWTPFQLHLPFRPTMMTFYSDIWLTLGVITLFH